jgi:hypothetical protein
VPPTTELALDIGLPFYDPQGQLPTIIQEVSDPTNANYRQFVNVSDFQARFGARPADYASLTTWAQSYGLTIARTFPSNLLLTVAGSASQFEQALFANLVFRLRCDGSSFVTVDREPSLNLTTKVLRITGLDDYVVPASSDAYGFPPQPIVSATTTTWTLPNGSTMPTSYAYNASDIRAAYLGTTGQCSGLLGNSQTVALTSFGPYDPNDIAAYDAAQTPPRNPALVTLMSSMQPPLFAPSPPNVIETTMDIEAVQAIAPNAAVHVYEGSLGITYHADDVLHAIANDPAVTVASNSWDYGRDDNSQQALNQMAAEGITFFNASRDFGNVGDPQNDINMDHQTLVGGTLLSTNQPVANAYPSVYYMSEDIWKVAPYGSKTVTGGGVMDGNLGDGPCFGWPFCSQTPTFIPGYQATLPASTWTTNGGSNVYRNYPDVAMLADNVALFYQGLPTSGYGTSLSAPFWAGFVTLINEAATINSVASRMGYMNPVLYGIGATMGLPVDLYSKCFHDVADGYSNWNAQANATQIYPSVPGYDLSTGWGTPTCGLVQQLSTFSPLTAYEEIELVVGALGNVRQDSDVRADIYAADNKTVLATQSIKNQGDGGYQAGDVRQFPNITLPYPVTSDDIGNIVITLTSHDSFPEGDDNWDMGSLQARLVNPGNAEMCLTTWTGSPSVRLTGSNPSHAFARGVGCALGTNPNPTLPEIQFIITTGNNTLDSVNEFAASVNYSDGTSQVLPLHPEDAPEWGQNGCVNVQFALNNASFIDSITIDDPTMINKWDINGLNILTTSPGSSPANPALSCFIDLNGAPLVEFSGGDGLCIIPPCSFPKTTTVTYRHSGCP